MSDTHEDLPEITGTTWADTPVDTPELHGTPFTFEFSDYPNLVKLFTELGGSASDLNLASCMARMEIPEFREAAIRLGFLRYVEQQPQAGGDDDRLKIQNETRNAHSAEGGDTSLHECSDEALIAEIRTRAVDHPSEILTAFFARIEENCLDNLIERLEYEMADYEGERVVSLDELKRLIDTFWRAPAEGRRPVRDWLRWMTGRPV